MCASLTPCNLRAGVGKPRAAMARPFAYSVGMQDSLVCALRTQRTQIRERWATLLRVEPVGSPLGHPDSLVYLIDWTLDEIFAGVGSPLIGSALAQSFPSGETPAPCACGRNPLLTFFSAGEQAVREGLVLAQVALVALDPVERDASLAELNLVLRNIARREIEAFCGVCQFRVREGALCPVSVSAFPQQPAES
jgi:hypothetical protein